MLIPNSVNIVGKSNNTPSIFYYIDYMKKVLAKNCKHFLCHKKLRKIDRAVYIVWIQS